MDYSKITTICGKVVIQEMPVPTPAGRVVAVTNDANPAIRARVIAVADDVSIVKVGDIVIVKLYSSVNITNIVTPNVVGKVDRIFTAHHTEILAILPENE